jgi:hypothetical protein
MTPFRVRAARLNAFEMRKKEAVLREPKRDGDGTPGKYAQARKRFDPHGVGPILRDRPSAR